MYADFSHFQPLTNLIHLFRPWSIPATTKILFTGCMISYQITSHVTTIYPVLNRDVIVQSVYRW
jgi:hypothetical protein